jgi:hypothetical protein
MTVGSFATSASPPVTPGGVSDPLGARRFVESEPGRGTTVRGELPAGSPL